MTTSHRVQRRVLFYIPTMHFGGPQRVVHELLANLPADSGTASLLTDRSGGVYWDKLTRSNVPCFSLEAPQRFPVNSFAKFMKAHEFDVVICTLDSILTAVTAKCLHRLRFPLVARPATHLTRYSLEMVRVRPVKHSLTWGLSVLAMHCANHIICQSSGIKGDLKRYLVPDKKLTVINNPIRIPQGLSRQPTTGPDRKRFVTLGRLAHVKGFDLLLEAVHQLPESIKNGISLEIYGEGPQRLELERMIERWSLQDTVRLCGHTNDTAAALDGADYYISSSRYEGFPNAVLEALATGIPVVATLCPGGIVDMVIPNQTGWTCAPNSASDLSKAISEAYYGEAMGPQGIQEFTSQRFDTDKIVAEYLQLIDRITRCPAV